MASDDMDVNHASVEIARLTAPGVLGFYTHFEITEIFALPEGASAPLNVFSILVAEERLQTGSDGPKFLGPRIKLKSLKGWTFGVQRTLKPISELMPSFDSVRTGEWCPSSKPLQLGDMVRVPVQFVPAESTTAVPWNNVLKNNFWSGSHIVEWADTKKSALKVFFDDPPSLGELSNAIQKYVPIRIASLSDRLGNIAVQLPVTVIIGRFGQIRLSGDSVVTLEWHPKATPRPLRASCEMQFDNMIVGYASATIHETQTVLPTAAGPGILRGIVWDDEHRVILAATGTSFFSTIAWNMHLSDPEPRVFTVRSGDGTHEQVRVGLSITTKHLIGAPAANRGEDWTHHRIYREETNRLAAARSFVQYKPKPGQRLADHENALRDIRHLLNRHGEEGAWLWDPFLSADDILATLFHCSHTDANLRALTAAQEPPPGLRVKPNLDSLIRLFREWIQQYSAWSPPPPPTFAEKQRAIFDNAQSNLRGLRLEYRMKSGYAGWAFHDRFLIFPKAEGGTLAWSLGTSVNSVGKQHHILQRVDDGQRVADAFNELWNQLSQPEHLIWKVP